MLCKPVLTILLAASLIGGTAIVPREPVAIAQPEQMAYIPGGNYTPQYSSDDGKVETAPFYLDKFPVTNADYYLFLEKYPEWKRDNARRVFVDEAYLKHWPQNVRQLNDLGILRTKPMVNISWFAAKKYCECLGKRLPTVNEWEFVALASETRAFGADDPAFFQKVLDWYSKPSGAMPDDVGSTFKNFYGVYDMYGLVWEWVLDFNTAMVGARFGTDANLDGNLFCGSGAAGTADPANYVAFMRYAFRSSLKANFSVGNLGFRCAKDVINAKDETR